MKRYVIFEHTADTGIRVTASTLQELFEESLCGMNEIIDGQAASEEKQVEESIILQATDTTLLLIDFLSDVLTFSHLHKAIFDRLTIVSLTETSISARLIGRTVGGFGQDVKAVTYHQAYARKDDDDFWRAQVIFDI